MKAHPATWFVYPTLLTTVVLGTQALLLRNAPPPLVAVGVMFSSVLVVMVIERLAPLHASWNRRPDAADVSLLFFNRIIDAGILASTLAVLGALQRAGVSWRLLHLWPTSAPLAAQALLGIVIAEGVRYVIHRLSHAPGVLWRWHSVHHRPERMYALNGPRLHPANQVWVAGAHVVPMLLLGAELRALALTASVTAFFVLFQHANVNLSFSGINRVLATPDVHRFHHLREQANEGVNYGIVFLIFDQLFGTYRPAREDATAIDADGIGLA